VLSGVRLSAPALFFEGTPPHEIPFCARNASFHFSALND